MPPRCDAGHERETDIDPSRRVFQVMEYIRAHSRCFFSLIYMDTSPSFYFLSGITAAESLDGKISIPVEIEYSIGEATRALSLTRCRGLSARSLRGRPAIYCQANTIHPPLTEPTQSCLQLTSGNQLSGRRAACGHRQQMNVRVFRKKEFIS